MKKQFTTVILFSIILFSCKKETTPEFIKNNDKIKTTMIAPPPPTVVTLQAIVLNSTVDIKFGWEEDGGFHVNNITSSGGGGGWQQGQTFWSTDPSNPWVIDIVIIGTYTYSSPGRFGVDKVKDAVFIQVFYNTRTGVKTTIVSRTSSVIVR